jgi:hypothetical protein
VSNTTGPSGMNNPAFAKFSIYPNPVQSTLYISDMKDANRVVISNIIGQALMTFDKLNTNYLQVNTSDLLKGLYIVTLYDQYGNASARKFMKD